MGEASAVHLEAGVTVFNDTSRDVLSGGADADWYVANVLGSGMRDSVDGFNPQTEQADEL